MRGTAFLLSLLLAAPLAAAEPGRIEGQIEGRVTRPDGLGLAGVTVSLETAEGVRTTVTDDEGRYAFAGVPAGSHSVDLRLGSAEARETVTVEAGATVEATTTVDWQPAFADTLTVEAASRQSERIVEAPSAVTVLAAEEIARSAAGGQLPRLLAGTPGVDVVQSGIFDWSLNARGFNKPINRRILTLLDGRDPSLPISSGGQEWGALAFPLDELAKVELVRGPGAALYGANAFNGVLSLVTKSPRESAGGRFRLTAGELDARRADARWAGEVGGDVWLKLVGAYEEGDDFTRARTDSVEYEGLPGELLAPPRGRVAASWTSLRLDRDFAGRLVTFEAGRMANAGITIVTDVGRTQRLEVDGPWARFAADSPHWSLRGSYSERDSDRELALSSGFEIYLLETRLNGELTGRTEFAGGRGRLVGGASFGRLKSDTADPAGRQTLYATAQEADETALFGQASYGLGPLEMVGSLRWDESDLHDGRLSPRAALVWAVHPRHTLRLSWSVGFQNPALSEFFLELPVAPPLDLSGIERQLAPLLGGTPLGLEAVPLLAVGNPDIRVEEVESFELGYSAILGQRMLLTANLYRSELADFTTPLVPTTGTSLGPFLSGSLTPYQPPAALSPEASRAVLQALAAALPPAFSAVLSQRADGSPYIPVVAFASAGRVETRGFELGLNAALDPWRLDLSYTFFDLELRGGAAESPLEANAPRNQAGLGASWTRGRWDGAVRARWVEGFDWRSGIFVGRVPSYEVVDLSFNAELTQGWRAGASVTNLLDDEHYQIFGGDLLARRALAYVAFDW